MYETHRHPLLSQAEFLLRVARHGAAATALMTGSLLAGVAGYMYYEGLSWVDGFLNAAMLLGGMGPVDPPKTEAGKLFAGCYALYAGLVFLVVVGVVLAPLLHRLLHKFHVQADQPGEDDEND